MNSRTLYLSVALMNKFKLSRVKLKVVRAIPVILLLIIQPGIALKAQVRIQGSIIDYVNEKPVAFATIGVKGRAIGTVADSAGMFDLQFSPDSAGADHPLIISCVGYKAFERNYNELLNNPAVIKLAPVSVNLNQVNVKPVKFKTKTFGRTGSSALMSTKMISEHNHTSDELGKEIGTVIDIDKNCRLNTFNLHVIFNHFKNIKFRLHIYSVKEGLPDTLIIKDDILFDVGEIRQQWVKVDLTRYQLYLQGLDKVAVAVQWLKSVTGDDPKRSFNISAVPASSKYILFRDKSQSSWLKVAGNISMNLTADCFKE